MKPRIDYRKTAPDGISALSGLENYVRQSGLEPALLELVKLRASQINGCSYCIDMHTRSEEHTSELQSRLHIVCRLLLEKKKTHQDVLLNPSVFAGPYRVQVQTGMKSS